jgi:toxin ParE1/3/4
MLPIIFRPGAQAEMREAYAWYEEREPGLGSDFMRCIDACLQLIRRHPEIFPATHKNIRQGVVRRFPCSIFYISAKEKIVVLSIFHSLREPKRWQRG